MTTIPVGGTTGHDHESTAAIDQAVDWLTGLEPHEKPSPVVPELQRRFGLCPVDCCKAIAEANLRRARAM